ncbi:unnamed protein product [Paramecium sonneborni]|uniref:Uncharacterized protein n=1 Tax=Paramecium sonneborni TaxID=65129 RepID=A0A8S1RHX0_9CILI|nr:unnamed protein product [Paramecium sonneborni]
MFNKVKLEKNSQNNNNFSYELIGVKYPYLKKPCQLIKINQVLSKVIVGQNCELSIYQFNSGKLKFISITNAHLQTINCIMFLLKSNQLISGSSDSTLAIWSTQGICSNKYQMKLKGNKFSVLCIILNFEENLLVSGNSDESLRFWSYQNTWKNFQTIVTHTGKVFNLYFNKECQQLISASEHQIQILNQCPNTKKWDIVYRIKTNYEDYSICFIDNCFISFLPKKSRFIIINHFNQRTKNIYKFSEILIQDGSKCEGNFNQQYINQKYILVVKSCNWIHLIDFSNKQEFRLHQSIKFLNSNISGSLSDDGEFLITWDSTSEELHIRQYF